jgi:Ca-activated chloride channel family protein
LQDTDAAVKEIMNQCSQIDKKALGDTSLYTYQTYYAWLALPMLLLLLTETFLPDRKRIKA